MPSSSALFTTYSNSAIIKKKKLVLLLRAGCYAKVFLILIFIIVKYVICYFTRKKQKSMHEIMKNFPNRIKYINRKNKSSDFTFASW